MLESNSLMSSGCWTVALRLTFRGSDFFVVVFGVVVGGGGVVGGSGWYMDLVRRLGIYEIGSINDMSEIRDVLWFCSVMYISSSMPSDMSGMRDCMNKMKEWGFWFGVNNNVSGMSVSTF